MLAFLKRQLREIEDDPALRLYGVALCVGHFLAFLSWRQSDLPKLLGKTIMPVCWPIFENCADWPRHSMRFWQLTSDVYALLAIVSGLWFLRGKTRRGLLGFAALFVFHLVLLSQDFRLRLNQHTMLMWVGLAFLLVPGKRFTLRALLVGLCVFQLGLFYRTSFSAVGFFYPLLLAALLSLFLLDRHFAKDQRVGRVELLRAAAVLLPFALLQLLPLTMPGDSAMTGQGRFLALHTFDAKLSCSATATLHYSDRLPQANSMRAILPDDLACDPLVYFHFARAICASNRGKDSFEDLDLELVTKRQNGPAVKVIEQDSLCSKPVHYSAFSANPWIHGR